ncbi:ribosomal protein S5 domain 2-type protein, partial [Mycena pura]
DSMAQTRITELGEHVVAAAGELHLEIALKDLGYLVGLSIKASSPVVPYRESVGAASSQPALAKSRSPNKHNYDLIYRWKILNQELSSGIKITSIGPITGRDDVPLRACALTDAHSWDAAKAWRIWVFGPDGTSGLNVLVEATKGVQHLHEIRDACVTGMHWATDGGVLEEEPMRSMRLNSSEHCRCHGAQCSLLICPICRAHRRTQMQQTGLRLRACPYPCRSRRRVGILPPPRSRSHSR